MSECLKNTLGNEFDQVLLTTKAVKAMRLSDHQKGEMFQLMTLRQLNRQIPT